MTTTQTIETSNRNHRNLLATVIAAFNAATSEAEYQAAKRLACRLPRNVQLDIVDAAIAARRRLNAGAGPTVAA